jgi:WD repeat-containing protein 48
MTKTPLQLLLSGPINPPSSSEARTFVLPPHIPIILSEDKSHGWTTLYRCTVSMAQVDLRVMEEAMPMWLLEYLLMNRFPVLSPTKISFIMLPWPTNDPEQQLPELLNS